MKGVGSLRSITGSADDGVPGRLWGFWGGWKNPECRVWGGVLNHADLNAVMAKVATIRWRHPESVQVFIKDQEEPYFQVWMCRGSKWRQYPPPPVDAADV